MNQLTCTSPGHLSYFEGDIQEPPEAWATIRIWKIGVCGTDLHAFEGTQPYFDYPRILGHELAGTIERTNSTDFKSGEVVTVVPYLHCGQCLMCVNGRTNACERLKVCGVHVDGGMREFFNVPASHLIAAGGLTLDQLALVEPLAVGAHAVRRAAVSDSDVVVVVGAGPIGYGIVLFAALQRAKVIVVDVDSFRLSLCSKIAGVHTLLGTSEQVIQDLNALTSGRRASVVFDATGNLGAIESAFQFMAHGARYILVGLQKGNISFSHPEFHKREGTLMSSRNATQGDFEFVMETIRTKRIDPTPMITHRIPFGRAADEFPSLLKRGNSLLKAVIEF